MKRAHFLRLLLLAPLGGQRLVASESGFARSVGFLLDRQSPDGAWRSEVYGAFRDGRALTPVVLRCLARIPDPELNPARARAARWMLERKDGLFRDFPVHLASAVLEASVFDEKLAPLRKSAVARLLELQGPDGGWSYSPVPATPGRPLPPMQQSNLSATAIALDGLHAAGAGGFNDPRPFLARCQNFAQGDPDYDDGGFFQMPDDPARNKAGTSGTDRHDRRRFRSYAAATADGIRCLLTAGEKPDGPAVRAAVAWLDGVRWGPDTAPADLAYYGARSIALTAARPGVRGGAVGSLATSLAEHRRADGSWINPAGEMRENCPLVATSLALEAVTLAAI